MHLSLLHGGAGDALRGLDWVELLSLVALVGILGDALIAWYVGARAQR